MNIKHACDGKDFSIKQTQKRHRDIKVSPSPTNNRRIHERPTFIFGTLSLQIQERSLSELTYRFIFLLHLYIYICFSNIHIEN